jgi:hypothetical protein
MTVQDRPLSELRGPASDYRVVVMGESQLSLIRKRSFGISLTHIPTNITVTCDSEPSQHGNRLKCVIAINEEFDKIGYAPIAHGQSQNHGTPSIAPR